MRIRDLIGSFSKGRLAIVDRAQLERALRFPWSRPRDPELADLVRDACRRPLHRPARGECAIVTVSEGGSRASLYRFTLERRSGSKEFGVPLVADAARAFELARRLISHDLAAFRPRGLAPGVTGFAELITREGQGIDAAIDGPSCGVAIALAWASLFADRDIADDLVASTALAADGRCMAVGGLARKLDFIASNVLGVRRVIVAAGQAEEARAHACNRLTIVPVSQLSDCFMAAFGSPLDETWAAALLDARGDLRQSARRLFELAVDGTPAILDWAAVDRIARVVASRAEAVEDLDAFREAELAASVARRHTGAAAPITWPETSFLDGMSRPRRIKVIAHAVQSAADSDDDLARRYVDAARPHLATPDQATECDWILLGALGRALAAIGLYRDAVGELESSVRGWASIGAIANASYPLSELLRVSGLLGDTDGISRVDLEMLPIFLSDPETSESSAAFVSLARARAYFELGAVETARDILESDDVVEWSALPPTLARPRCRWLARTYLATGEVTAARRLLGELETREPDDQLLLARLDLALSVDEPVAPHLVALRQNPLFGYEVNRTIARCKAQDDAGVGRWLAAHYRY